MVEEYRRAAEFFPSEMMGGYRAVIEKLMAADWADPDSTAQNVFGEYAKLDFQPVYSKFMVNCLRFWLSPEEVRKEKGLERDRLQAEVAKKSERAFDVMWIAFERWMARGLSHYAEVATALGKFYTQLRWGMTLQRSTEGIPPDMEKQIAEEAYYYLLHVQSLVEESYSSFQEEMKPILSKLIEINPDIANREQKRRGT